MQAQGAVDGLQEAEILGIAKQRDVAFRGKPVQQRADAGIGRRVVDDDDLRPGGSVPARADLRQSAVARSPCTRG